MKPKKSQNQHLIDQRQQNRTHKQQNQQRQFNKHTKRQQPISVFISAGRNAFKIGVDPVNNPYSKLEERNAWNKGFFDEMNTRELVRPAHGARPQLRLKYSAAYRLPYGEKLPEKLFFRRERFIPNAEAHVEYQEDYLQKRDRGY